MPALVEMPAPVTKTMFFFSGSHTFQEVQAVLRKVVGESRLRDLHGVDKRGLLQRLLPIVGKAASRISASLLDGMKTVTIESK